MALKDADLFSTNTFNTENLFVFFLFCAHAFPCILIFNKFNFIFPRKSKDVNFFRKIRTLSQYCKVHLELISRQKILLLFFHFRLFFWKFLLCLRWSKLISITAKNIKFIKKKFETQIFLKTLQFLSDFKLKPEVNKRRRKNLPEFTDWIFPRRKKNEGEMESKERERKQQEKKGAIFNKAKVRSGKAL